jgi:branched-chain amino acid aminotransferase
LDIKVELTTQPKVKPQWDKLIFGKSFTDHMFMMDYSESEGWHDAKIVPYAPIACDPSIMALHYGQGVFEGLKAYKTDEGKVLIFRPEMNFKRMNVSNERMCIPQIDVNFAVKALYELVKIDSDWVPTAPDTSLYIRPFVFATEVALGVHASDAYKFMIIMSPVCPYYPEGLNPVKILIETEYVRAVRGGIGHTKAIANYAISLAGQRKAKQQGYTQVLWLDGIERKYIEEVGTMNVFFKINGEIITPPLGGTILAGVTRDSSITLMKSWGLKIVERHLTVEEVYNAHAEGKLEEAFGTGTAAAISPIGHLNWNSRDITINGNQTGEVARKLYDQLMGIQYGRVEDKLGWTTEVK